MKKFFRSSMFVAAVAMAFVGCSKDDTTDISVATGKQVEMTIVADGNIANAPESKTLIDEEHLQMKWSETDEVLKVLQVADGKLAAESTTGYTKSGDSRTATFTVKFTENTSATLFGYSAVYPAVNYIESNNSNPAKFKVLLPVEQTPAETSFDPNADLLLAKYQTSDTQLTEAQFRFHRIAAMAKMTVKGITAGETITKVEFSTTNATASKKKPLAGRSYVDLTTSTVEIGYSGEAKYDIVLNTANRTATGEDAFWFTCYPCTLSGADGDTFTVTVTTDVAQYTKTVDLTGKEIVFESANLTRFSVNNLERNLSATDEYVLLTDAADLGVGDKIIITSATNGACTAISTTQSKNNRPETDITIADSKITTIPADVQIIEIENGTQAGTYALKVEDGYLAAASSSSNLLHTDADKTDASSWDITIDKSVATIKAKQYSRNWLRHNTSSKIFSCYESGQSPVYIFYKPDTAPRISVTENTVNIDAKATTNSIAYSVKNIEGSISAESSADWLTIGTVSADGVEFTPTANYEKTERTATVTLSYEGAADVVVTVKQAGSTFEVTPAEVIIPAAGTEATFTVLSKEFDWTATSDNATITVTPASGSASETEATVTVSSNAAATAAEQTLGTITVIRSGETTGVTVTVKKAVAGSKEDLPAPTVNVSDISTSGFIATWENVTGAESYEWKLLATQDVDNADVIKSGTASAADGIMETDLQLTAGTTYYLYVKSLPTNTDTHNPSAWAEVSFTVPAAVTEKTVTIDLSKQGYNNGDAVTTVTDASGVVLTFDEGTSSTSPKYYDGGTAVRVYGGGSLTVSGKTITGIEFGFGSSDGSNAITADSGTYTAPTWTGKAESVKFTIGGSKGNRRFKTVTVTYTE